MSASYFTSKWRARLKMLYFSPYSNRSLRYFPPEFTFRDPVVSLVHRCRRKGDHCAVIVFDVENYSHMLHSYPAALLENMHERIKHVFKTVLPLFFSQKDLIGVKQIPGQGYGVFVRGDREDSFLNLHDQSIQIRDRLESELAYTPDRKTHESLKFQTGFFVIDRVLQDTGKAIHIACQYAHAIAAKKLPQSFYYTRKQLSDIIDNENISVLAQPIMNLRSGDIFGWEILTRGPRHTPFYFPAELFEFAHQSDLLYKMESLVLRKAFQEISEREINEQVFINVTSISLCHPMFLEEILGCLAQFPGIEPSQIVLEITERHKIGDFRQMTSIMGKCRQHGFRFAVDDAGAGYASLHSISELIPDMIKIDKALIKNIDQASAKQSLLKALLLFAENINCRVIAEGVEREEEAEILFQHEVEMGQGYYFAPPKPLLFNHERLHFDELKNRIRLRAGEGPTFA